jgi:hypothetical protein
MNDFHFAVYDKNPRGLPERKEYFDDSNDDELRYDKDGNYFIVTGGVVNGATKLKENEA